MAELHKALNCLRPIDYSNVPVGDDLGTFLQEILTNAELIGNSVPLRPDGISFESATRTRTNQEPAIDAINLTLSEVRRPPLAKEHEDLKKLWGKPLKMGSKEAATGMSVFKMAGHDRHGAWFARVGVFEGLGFAKWKSAMIREFPQSLLVEGGPGAGNVRGIGGDQRLEEITVDGIAKLEVYQLSAQFPGPTSPREFITLVITSDNCLTEASKIGDAIPRHFMIVSIPVTHPEAPARTGLVRGYYESIEMIREIPLTHSKNDEEDAERNPVEWIMVTRSDPGGGIPRFMVERSVPSSIVTDAVKLLDWACASNEAVQNGIMIDEYGRGDTLTDPDASLTRSIVDSSAITTGIETSKANKLSPSAHTLPSQVEGKATDDRESLVDRPRDSQSAPLLDPLDPLEHSLSKSSTSTLSSVESFASAEQFYTAPDDTLVNGGTQTPSSASLQSIPAASDNSHKRQMLKMEEKMRKLQEKLERTREKQSKELKNETQKTQKEIEKAMERRSKERKKQEDKFQREMRKIEDRRERETKKFLARQQKEAEQSRLQKACRERDEYKQRMEMVEQENRLLKEQVGELQMGNTALAAELGRRGGLRTAKGKSTYDEAGTALGDCESFGKSGNKSEEPSEAASTS